MTRRLEDLVLELTDALLVLSLAAAPEEVQRQAALLERAFESAEAIREVRRTAVLDVLRIDRQAVQPGGLVVGPEPSLSRAVLRRMADAFVGEPSDPDAVEMVASLPGEGLVDLSPPPAVELIGYAGPLASPVPAVQVFPVEQEPDRDVLVIRDAGGDEATRLPTGRWWWSKLQGTAIRLDDVAQQAFMWEAMRVQGHWQVVVQAT